MPLRACVCSGVGSGKEHPPLVEWPEGISFMKSDNIQATPSSLFYKSSLTLINEVEAGRERGREGGKSCGRRGGGGRGCDDGGKADRERSRGRDTNSLAGPHSGSITFGELLSTPVWQLYHRGWKERMKGRGQSKKRDVEKAALSLLVTLFFANRGN